MVDDQHADLLRQRCDCIEDDVALGRGHAGGGLVEQQHLGIEPECDGKFDQPLAAVRQFGDAVLCVVGKLEHDKESHRLLDHVLAHAGRLEHGIAGAEPFGHRDVDVLQHREPTEQTVDLEGAGDAALDARGLRHGGDVFALEQHLSTRWQEHAGEEIDERRLARAVGSDQRVARALFKPEIDVACGCERAEILRQRSGFQQRHGRACLRAKSGCSWSHKPMMPLRANSAISTSRRPSPSCQAVG